MAALPQLQELDSKVADILAVPSFLSYCRVLSMVEELTELASSSPDTSTTTTTLLQNCDTYRTLCNESISRLAEQASQYEHETYKRAALKISKEGADSNSSDGSSQSEVVQRKHRGVVFNVYKGVHIAAAVEALNLEEFLKEQQERGAGAPKKVRFVNLS